MMRCLAVVVALLPSVALAQPADLPSPCTTEHVAIAGHPSACSGVLSPAQTALDGARCIDAALPACQALRKRDTASHARKLSLVTRDAADAEARAKRWQALALAPQPVPPPRVVTHSRGVPAWLLAPVGVVAVALGLWVGLSL